MLQKEGPALYLRTDGGTMVQVVLLDINGMEECLPKRTPTEELIAVMDRDYSAFSRELTRLREEHPLFEEREMVYWEDYVDFVAKAQALLPLLAEIDYAAAFILSHRLNAVLQIPDDQSASVLLEAGTLILHNMEEPILSQVRLRNIFEIAFDDYERGTQRDRFEAVEQAWPGLLDRFFLARCLPAEGGDPPIGSRWEYSPDSLYELYLTELSLYFRQSAQRIARCENCWHYFIPKTKKKTLYCDREFDSAPCKKAGPNLKRKLGPEYDGALRIYKQLHARMAERLERYVTAPEEKRSNLFPMTLAKYDEWITIAGRARMDYLSEKISSEEFLQTIDVYGELSSYQTTKAELVDPRNTEWRRRVQRDINFNPATAYQNMMLLDLRQGENSQWQIFTPEDIAKMERAGQKSLREKYKSEENDDKP